MSLNKFFFYLIVNLVVLFFHRVKSIAGLKYEIQADIDSLQTSRQQLMDRLLEVDSTMDNPRDEDIEGQRYCPKCYDGSGSLCIQCELDELFQVVTHQCLLMYLCPYEINHLYQFNLIVSFRGMKHGCFLLRNRTMILSLIQ